MVGRSVDRLAMRVCADYLFQDVPDGPVSAPSASTKHKRDRDGDIKLESLSLGQGLDPKLNVQRHSGPELVPSEGVRVRLTCVSWLPRIGSRGEAIRTSDSVTFVGVKEELSYELSGDATLLHKRILFRSTVKIGGTGIGPGSDAVGGVARRSITTPDSIPLQFYSSFFPGGISGGEVDPISTKLDPSVATVLSEDLVNYEPKNASGGVRQKKYWKRIGADLSYGGGVGSGTDCYVAGTCGFGNVYLLDIFRNLEKDTDVDAAKVSSVVTVYWRDS